MLTGTEFLRHPKKWYTKKEIDDLVKSCNEILLECEKEMRFNKQHPEYSERKKFYTRVQKKLMEEGYC